VSGMWRTYGFWFFWVSVAFFAVYPLCNWLTAKRDSSFNLYVTQELGIPFIPEFIWVYLSYTCCFSCRPSSSNRCT